VATFSPDQLRTRRESAGLSREHLAIVVARSSQTIGYWERGVVTPSLRSLAVVAERLGCTVDDLYETRSRRSSR
jgi:DNA-binding XRE family transcriptional regulator